MFAPDSNLASYWEDITIPCNSSADLSFIFTDPTTNEPYSLSGLTATFWRKSSRNVPDTSATSYAASTTSTPGEFTVSIPSTDNTIPGVGWYRLDLISATETKTVKMGHLELFAV